MKKNNSQKWFVRVLAAILAVVSVLSVITPLFG